MVYVTPVPTTPILEIEGLSKRYGPLSALEDVHLSIRPGEIFALLGPNGAGKTTLIGAVCGLVKKTAGKIRLFGTDLDKDPLTPRYSVGLVPQEVNFDPFFSAEEALAYQLGFYGQRKDPARIAEVLAALNLTEKAKARTRALSGGMRRRLLIAKALVHRPKLVFLDEPTAGVDVELRRDLWRYVERLKAEGTTLILTTHYLEEAEQLADRVGVIHRGKLLLVEDKTSLMKRLGERRLEVSFSAPVASLPAEVTAAGGALEDSGMRLGYRERPAQPTSAEVLAKLYAAGLPVADVDTRRSKLEDVLLEILRSAT